MTWPVPAPVTPTIRPSGRYPLSREALPRQTHAAGSYELSFARTRDDLDAILRLRFEVFNLELGEGLRESYATGRDEDELDRRFHHLMILDRRSGRVVGTYRMQTPEMAERLGGFYTAGEFNLAGFPPRVLARSVEVGRACVARDHRNGRVLHLLWRGIATYLAWNRKTGLFGCCSLTSQDPALGLATLRHLESAGHMHPTIRVEPLPAAACATDPTALLPPAHIPALFQTYLNLGARVCGAPAMDRLFQTIDFVVHLDVHDLDPRVYRSYF
jgi:putative hemolysin